MYINKSIISCIIFVFYIKYKYNLKKKLNIKKNIEIKLNLLNNKTIETQTDITMIYIKNLELYEIDLNNIYNDSYYYNYYNDDL